MLKIVCAVSTRCHGKHTKYVSFLWLPVVAAYDCKGLAQALPSSASYSAKKNCACTQDSVTSVGLCRSRCQMKITFATTIKKGQGQMLKHIVIYIYMHHCLHPLPPCVSSSVWHFFDPLCLLLLLLLQSFKGIDSVQKNDGFITSNSLYGEVL